MNEKLRHLFILAWLCLAASSASAANKASDVELAAISARGRLLAEYDAVAWRATDLVIASHPTAEPSGHYIARLTEAGWVVDFGRLNGDRDRFSVEYEAVQQGSGFEIKSFNPVRQDVGWSVGAARGIDTAVRDFGERDRPYNVAVLPTTGGELYVYLYPAQVKEGVYPLGGDVRYRMSPDGKQIVEKRQMHVTVIDYAMPKDSLVRVASGYHNHVMSNVPEDTDVMLVLMRHPRFAESVRAGGYIYTIKVDGTIGVSTQIPSKNLSGH